jgi:hypothetical protein
MTQEWATKAGSSIHGPPNPIVQTGASSTAQASKGWSSSYEWSLGMVMTGCTRATARYPKVEGAGDHSRDHVLPQGHGICWGEDEESAPLDRVPEQA